MRAKIPILQMDVSFDVVIFPRGGPFEKRGLFRRKFTEKMTNYGQTGLNPFQNNKV